MSRNITTVWFNSWCKTVSYIKGQCGTRHKTNLLPRKTRTIRTQQQWSLCSSGSLPTVHSTGVEPLGTYTTELTRVSVCGVTSAGSRYSVGSLGLGQRIPAP